jgi:PAS domain S-box-containing protein
MTAVNERLAEDPWAAVVESSADAIIVMDLDGVIWSWNRAAEKLFGYTVAEVIRQPITLIFPPDRAAEEKSILDRIGRGESVDNYETERRRKDGQNIRVAVTISPVIGAGGMIVGSSTILRDLTGRDARDQRIHELEAEVARLQRLVEVGHTVSALVHEISEPLTAINNYVNACRHLTMTEDREKALAALEFLLDQSIRAQGIVRRIRDYVSKGDVQM